ncbi:MAG: UDP-N-acetylmuramate dehydrogenase [Candidatus Eisenbacteria bacterium]|nr:UDP-N-acetylmuramate dehydrogenase [Candidatus Eisenbacteria bacterium]
MRRGSWTEGARLAPFTSWRIGGPCRALAEPATPEELTISRREAERLGWPVFLLGGGTNLLVADEGYPGLVVRYAARGRSLEVIGDRAIVRAEARMPLAGLARETARSGWAGMEWAEGIPGTLAGAAVGNAGAYGGQMADVVVGVEVVLPDGKLETWPPGKMEYGYRRSALKGRDPAGPTVVAVQIELERDDPERLAAEIRRIAGERKSRTPAGASCGSVFRNPPGTSAGRLIDQAGCKGLRKGGAFVSDLHANYILNEGGARARDVLDLIDEVRRRVRGAFGISLELEIQLVGFGESV